MQDKQKVTLYLSPELHRRLKIRAAIDSEPMSELAARAIAFYLSHPDVVEEMEASYGRTHQVYACPECATSVAVRDGELVSLTNQPGVIPQEQNSVEQIAAAETTQEGKQELVPCLS
jgi:hypothetical protein